MAVSARQSSVQKGFLRRDRSALPAGDRAAAAFQQPADLRLIAGGSGGSGQGSPSLKASKASRSSAARRTSASAGLSLPVERLRRTPTPGGLRAFPVGPLPRPVEAFRVTICDGCNTSTPAGESFEANIVRRASPGRSGRGALLPYRSRPRRAGKRRICPVRWAVRELPLLAHSRRLDDLSFARGYTPVTASPLHSCSRQFTPVLFRSRPAHRCSRAFP
jgi:hypothetical protein